MPQVSSKVQQRRIRKKSLGASIEQYLSLAGLPNSKKFSVVLVLPLQNIQNLTNHGQM